MVLEWTGTWWPGVDDKKARERKRLIALVGPLMDQNLVVPRVRERKRLIPLVYAESQQSPVLRARAAARRHRTPSRVGEGTARLLKRGLEARART